MKNELVKNQYYSIAVDAIANRIYLKINGYWRSVQVVPDYFRDWRRARDLVKPGFTILSDLIEMKPPAKEVAVLHEQVQHWLVMNGLKRTAELVPDTLLEIHLDQISDQSKMFRRPFTNIEEALKWLNE